MWFVAPSVSQLAGVHVSHRQYLELVQVNFLYWFDFYLTLPGTKRSGDSAMQIKL